MNDLTAASSDLASVDETAFRAACGKFPTGVAVITTLDANANPVGLTANSFTSAALSPPMVLWTVGPNARSFESFLGARYYAVHLLHKDQQDLAAHFAGRSDDKFADLDWQAGHGGLPILPDFSACLECAVEDVHPCGNQRLMIGRVINIIDRDRADALVYFRSAFGSIETG